MKVWDDKDADIGYWNLLLNGREVVSVHDEGNFYKMRARLSASREELHFLDKIPVGEMKDLAETWYAGVVREYMESWVRSLWQCENDLKALEGPSVEEPLVDIGDFEYADGYLHFRVTADDYSLEGLYRLYDPANGPDMTLVSIHYGYMHPIIERQWGRIEEALYDASLSRYHDILDKSEAFKEKVVAAMEAAGYTYDVLESHEGWESFYGEGGARMGFDRLREAAEWLEGVVFDDPIVGRKVEEIMHPERQVASGSVEAMIGDAKERCVAAGAGENKAQEHVKD